MRRAILPALCAALFISLESARLDGAIVVYRQGLDGYMGTQDTELELSDPTTPHGDNTSIAVDLDGHAQDLIRFDNIFQEDGGRIPTGATINSAEFSFYAHDPSGAAAMIGVNRMLRDWDEATATWDSMLAPLMTDDFDAVATADDFVPAPDIVNTRKSMDVSASVVAWQGGADNFGWLISQDTTGGFDWYSSEHSVEDQRPALTIDFTPPSMAPDFDGDGDVDADDFAILRGNMYTHLDGNAVTFNDGDIDFDLDVDLVDFRLFKSQFPGALGAAAGVPEPGTLGLLVVGLAGLLLARRRRRSAPA